MQRPCDSCGETYEAKRATSKFCTTACRVRGARGALAAVPDLQVSKAGPVVEATRAELEKAERLDTALGQTALALAARLDSNRDTGSGYAALSKELRSVLAEATKGVAVEESTLDRLQRLRLKRLGRGA